MREVPALRDVHLCTVVGHFFQLALCGCMAPVSSCVPTQKNKRFKNGVKASTPKITKTQNTTYRKARPSLLGQASQTQTQSTKYQIPSCQWLESSRAKRSARVDGPAARVDGPAARRGCGTCEHSSGATPPFWAVPRASLRSQSTWPPPRNPPSKVAAGPLMAKNLTYT